VNKSAQKEAVFTAVVNVLKEEGIKIIEGKAVTMSKEQRAKVNGILFDGFRAGNIELEDASSYSDSDLKGYVSGLQSNWLRKDKRLNGGTQYVAKNPGSRAGSGDASLKAMKTLLSTLTKEEEKAEVQAHIDSRLAEIAASKAKTVAIDYTALPADLAAKFKKS